MYVGSPVAAIGPARVRANADWALELARSMADKAQMPSPVAATRPAQVKTPADWALEESPNLGVRSHSSHEGEVGWSSEQDLLAQGKRGSEKDTDSKNSVCSEMKADTHIEKEAVRMMDAKENQDLERDTHAQDSGYSETKTDTHDDRDPDKYIDAKGRRECETVKLSEVVLARRTSGDGAMSSQDELRRNTQLTGSVHAGTKFMNMLEELRGAIERVCSEETVYKFGEVMYFEGSVYHDDNFQVSSSRIPPVAHERPCTSSRKLLMSKDLLSMYT